MRASDRHGRVARVALCGAMACALAAGPAAAEGLTGSLQGQFQRFERRRLVTNADGTTRTETVTRELWVQTYDFNHQAYLRPTLLVQSNFRYSDLQYARLPEASRSPYASLRLVHPWFGAYAAHQPTATTGTIGPRGVGSPDDTLGTLEVTSRTQETSFGGNLGFPGLPRVDVTWIRRHRDADAIGTEATSVQRFARMTYERSGVSVHGSYGDQSRQGEVPGRADVLSQRNLTGGAAWHLAPWRATSLVLGVDATEARTPRATGADVVSRGQTASLSGERRESERLVWNLSYNARRFSSGDGIPAAPPDHEGSLLLNYTPSRSTRLTAGGGVRSRRIENHSRLARYVTAVASTDGKIRPRWNGVASVSHTTTWDPGLGLEQLETAQLGARGRVMPGLDADAGLQMSAQSDTVARADRHSRELSFRLRARPLRSLSVGLAQRFYQVGPSLTVSSGRSRVTTFDARWLPVRSLELSGSHSVTGTLPLDRPRVSSDAAQVRFLPTRALQISGAWSRSQETLADATSGTLRGREIASGRAALALSGSLSVNGGLSVADPGTSRESRQVDVAVVMGFRR